MYVYVDHSCNIMPSDIPRYRFVTARIHGEHTVLSTRNVSKASILRSRSTVFLAARVEVSFEVLLKRPRAIILRYFRESPG